MQTKPCWRGKPETEGSAWELQLEVPIGCHDLLESIETEIWNKWLRF